MHHVGKPTLPFNGCAAGQAADTTAFNVRCCCSDHDSHREHANKVNEYGRGYVDCYTLDGWVCHCMGDEEFTNRLPEDTADMQCMDLVKVVECEGFQTQVPDNEAPSLLVFCRGLLSQAGGSNLIGESLLVYWYEALPVEN
ncbi:hypothetical protein CEUSTIGMA_g8534.t1 [Chlamydomonas eustigma]|uniref:Uncharacterized protein n=1 Tax=Chlamydomonas eustigma TaxID=1157962 RepID=A0A250XEB0_9CHLO|nr:hypothetical protein CEUSTIGMA_g8534.t1 [Chlamydomonas eustigma]|eukprot:GAX81100.1 hypothetical protein CEUSTIGMA_g8534.t1 [Chlamydomonas eustigma]